MESVPTVTQPLPPSTVTLLTSASEPAQGQFANYTVPEPSQVATLAFDCTDAMSEWQTSTSSLACGIDYYYNDIASFWAYTLEHCIQACSSITTVTGDALELRGGGRWRHLFRRWEPTVG